MFPPLPMDLSLANTHRDCLLAHAPGTDSSVFHGSLMNEALQYFRDIALSRNAPP